MTIGEQCIVTEPAPAMSAWTGDSAARPKPSSAGMNTSTSGQELQQRHAETDQLVERVVEALGTWLSVVDG